MGTLSTMLQKLSKWEDKAAGYGNTICLPLRFYVKSNKISGAVKPRVNAAIFTSDWYWNSLHGFLWLQNCLTDPYGWKLREKVLEKSCGKMMS